MSMGSALCVCTSVFLNPNLFPVLQSNTVIIPMIILIYNITSLSPLEVQEIPLHYDVPVYDFWDFFHVYMFLQILQSYYIFCIYNFILFCIYLLAFLQSIKVHVNVYILPSINTLALRCVKIINWILFLQTKYSFWIKVIR